MMRENPPLLPLVGSDLTRFAAAPLSRNSNATASSLPARPCRSSSPQYSNLPSTHLLYGRSSQCRGESLEPSGQLRVLLRPRIGTGNGPSIHPQSIAEPYSSTTRHMNTVDGQQEVSEDQTGDVGGQDGFFDREEFTTTSMMTIGNLAPSTHKRPTSRWTTYYLNWL